MTPAPLRSFAFLLLAVPAGLHAQVVGGTLAGTVTDPSGAVIAAATVVVTNEETGTARHLSSNSAGTFSAPSLPIGHYSVSAGAEGFATYKRTGIPLTVGESVELTLSLVPAGTASVEVTDAPSAVNLSTEQTAGLVGARELKELPLNGRSYDQLITLNPGAVNYTAQRSGVGTSNSSVGSMFAVSGRRPQDNLFLLNGVEYTGASLINVTPGGASGQLLGVDAVREFNLVTDTYSAAYGKRDGAQVSIVTTSGTNSLHGSAYEFLRNSFFDARNYFDQARIPRFQRNDAGASLGGPLRRNALFLFGNYESYRQNLGVSDVSFVPDATSRAAAAPSIRPLLNLWPEANGPELLDKNGSTTGIAEAFSSPVQHIREDFGTVRFDANLTPNDQLFAVYTVDDSTAHTPTQNPLSLINESLREQVASVQEQHVFSPRVLNTARFGYSRASFFFLGSVPPDAAAASSTFIPGKPVGAIVIAGSTASNGSSQITAAGANVGSNNAVTRNLFTFDDHVFVQLGTHTLEAGVWTQRLQSNDNLAQNQFGQASFASLSAFLAGKIKTFTYVPQPTPLNWRTLFSAGYIEDTWHVTPRLVLRTGFRSESTTGWNEAHGRTGVYTFTNGVMNTTPSVQSGAFTDNRAKFLPNPRLGVAWNVFGNGRTSVRASVGYHHSLLDALDYRLDQSAPFNSTLTYSNTTVSNPTAGTASVSPSTVQPDLATPNLLAYNLRLEQQVWPAASLTVGYSGSRSRHQILSADLNEPAFVICPNLACPASLAPGTVFYPSSSKANPALANTTSWISTGSGNYNALLVDFRQHPLHGIELRASYTYAKGLDNGSAWNTSVSANTPAYVSVPQLPQLDYGPSATDIRHVATLTGSIDLPFGSGARWLGATGARTSRLISGWTLATITTLESGFPFSPQLGYNPTNSGDTRNPVRPDLNPGFRGSLYTHGRNADRAAQFFNPLAFQTPVAGATGNVPRDTLVGPGYANVDFSLLKTTRINEAARLQFRAEFFNALNHTNLQLPNPVVATAANTYNPTAGVITSAGSSRQIQLALKLMF